MMNKNNPYEFKNPAVCAVCGHSVLEDDFGNSDVCQHCGWENCKDNEIWDKSMGISYPMLVPLSRAREQYNLGLPFKATFEDFIHGLRFYCEMTFEHKEKKYEVFFKKKTDGKSHVIFCDKDFQQEFESAKEFQNKANINGKLLKDIWDEIDNPSYMW